MFKNIEPSDQKEAIVDMPARRVARTRTTRRKTAPSRPPITRRRNPPRPRRRKKQRWGKTS